MKTNIKRIWGDEIIFLSQFVGFISTSPMYSRCSLYINGFSNMPIPVATEAEKITSSPPQPTGKPSWNPFIDFHRAHTNLVDDKRTATANQPSRYIWQRGNILIFIENDKYYRKVIRVRGGRSRARLRPITYEKHVTPSYARVMRTMRAVRKRKARVERVAPFNAPPSVVTEGGVTPFA